jgi:Fe-S cluster assembly ATP-binding protein
MLSIANIHVSVDDQLILKGFNLAVAPGTVHALMGPNGSGKSTLAYTLIGHPQYQVTAGTMQWQGIQLNDLSPDKRAKLGIFLAFQQPLAIPGVTVGAFLKEAYQAITGITLSVADFNTLLFNAMAHLGMDQSFAIRCLNDGFSGGEKKRLEILQMLILKPTLAILDEIDSGLDIDALKAVAVGIAQARRDNPTMSIIIITHYQRILDYLTPNYVHIVHDGAVITSGTADLVHTLESKGYDAFIQRA